MRDLYNGSTLINQIIFLNKFIVHFSSQKATFNCEMSDLDQGELKLNVHYVHVSDRDFWLFAWNPFDYSCRDKVNTIGGSRVNNDRRMDIFREPGKRTLLDLCTHSEH